MLSMAGISFRISRTDYARHLEDLKYENIRGDQTTSIDAKAMLQLIVYGAWNNLGLDDALPIAVKGKKPLTLSHIFDLAGEVDCLGWLKEFHKVAFERYWERVHEIFHVLLERSQGSTDAQIPGANRRDDDAGGREVQAAIEAPRSEPASIRSSTSSRSTTIIHGWVEPSH